MDPVMKRKRDQCRLRVRKHRAIKKALDELQASSDSSASSAQDVEEALVDEEATAEPSLISDDGSFSDENHDTIQGEVSDSHSTGTKYNFGSNAGSSDEGEEDLDDDVDFIPPRVNIENLEEQDIQEIRKWALKNRIQLSHLDDLLTILRRRMLPMLPKTAKTFLRTVDAKYNIEEMEDANGDMGEFVYFGIENGLKDCVNVDLHDERLIELQVNVDPVPLTESGTQQFTPILCKIHFDPDVYEVFPVAIYFGQAKVKNAELFLDQFVDEMNKLHRDGIVISNEHLDVRLKCFICDTPARAFLKNTLGHGGQYSCERCEVQGERVRNRYIYQSTDSRERTTDSFRNRSQPQHHHPGPSPLLGILGINIIACFVLDFMHLCCIGITKKLLEYWLTGDLRYRLSRRDRELLSERMEVLHNQVPCEFQRKPRATRHVGKWKATEFRFFLLYAGPIVLKNILNDNLYKHFLLLFTACRILSSKLLCHQYTTHAKKYLTSFFVGLKDYYCPESQITNAHHLIHVADDVTNMGCSLTRITAFPFESYLGRMKKWLRTPNRPLSQLCRRLHEQKFLKKKKPTLPPVLDILKRGEADVKRIKLKEVIISNSAPDNIVMLEDNTVVTINRIFGDIRNLKFEGQIWGKKKPLFTYPTNSKHLNIWELQKQPTPDTTAHYVSSVASKLVKLSLGANENHPKKTIVIPFLH